MSGCLCFLGFFCFLFFVVAVAVLALFLFFAFLGGIEIKNVSSDTLSTMGGEVIKISHLPISLKHCFEKYYSCDKAYQCSSTPCLSYLEKLIFDEKYKSKRAQFFTVYIKRCVSKTC